MSSPIFPIQELYYETILKRILSRIEIEGAKGCPIVESFELEAIVDNLDKKLEPLGKELDFFTWTGTVRRADDKDRFLLCVSTSASRFSQTPEEVIQRLYEVSRQGNRTAVECCASYRSARTLAEHLESLEFACEVVDRFVFIEW